MARLELRGLDVEITHKAVKHLHLSVLPPQGKVRVTAPRHMSLDTIRVFVISRLGWIRAQQGRLQAQERETPREYLERESHYVWGRRCLMQRVEKEAAPGVSVEHRKLVLRVRPGSDEAKCREVLDAWYREQIRAALPALLARWEPVLGVRAGKVFVQRMKTRWGSCNPATGAIRLNTDLARKPPECLEYIVVHELAHLLEPTHNARFTALMDAFLPQWRHLREVLNRLPVRHEAWQY